MTEIDIIDRCLIALLQLDGRLSHAEIARRLGIPEPTIRRRLKRLIDDEVIQVVAVPNPHKIGFGIHAIVGAKVHPGQVGNVIAALASMSQVRYVGITAGAYDVIIEALFQDNTELRVFLTETLGQINGLQSTETSYVLEVAKRSYKIGLSDQSRTSDLSSEEDEVLDRCRQAFIELDVERAGVDAMRVTWGGMRRGNHADRHC